MFVLITDGRFSGATRGIAVGHISPEAASGGPIALIEDGDEITIDLTNRTLNVNQPGRCSSASPRIFNTI
ncbi:hypothetical protein ACVNPX_14745 [Staphylococcus aureus]